MIIVRKIIDVLIFSIILTLILPFLVLPYGIFIIHYAFIASFLFFLLPIFTIALIIRFAFLKIDYKRKIRFSGLFVSVMSLLFSVYLVSQRGTGEYFGNNPITYIQLVFASIVGFYIWSFLTKNIVFVEENEV